MKSQPSIHGYQRHSRTHIKVKDIPTVENWPMRKSFYTSEFAENTTSTTIIFNVFKGKEDVLEKQLREALDQQRVERPEVWVMCFNSSKYKDYEKVVAKVRANTSQDIVFTSSNYNYKFHGRFLLAYMATTKYVLIVDDDRMIDNTTVAAYIQCMKHKRGVWGNRGHLRAPTFEKYTSWPKHYVNSTKKYVTQDYLSGMWFFEQKWLEFFFKERIPSWETAEDMHLSHVVRKYLNLETYGGNAAYKLLNIRKKHQATKGKALDLREYIFDHELGRGNKIAGMEQPIQTLVYAETVDDILDFHQKVSSCTSRQNRTRSVPWCGAGKTAVVFRGAIEQNIAGMINASIALCEVTNCEYYALKPKIKHPIRYYNMRQNFGQTTSEKDIDLIPYQTSASDILQTLVGIMNNVRPETFFIPDVSSKIWADSSKRRNRLVIYHQTVKLAVQIYLNTRTQQRSDDTSATFPKLDVHIWKHSILFLDKHMETTALYQTVDLEAHVA
ncbi:unnamed protein product [Albugo candida]|uniref:Uncharacterized protein n=1 Tax=Albugo candida TaxID=65357 RepID=A0A024G885_9STRA|nr:unnamed protein product [Albugo candida]|eukprot:CCI42770.1 unnamed protein product [Albugo candida]